MWIRLWFYVFKKVLTGVGGHQKREVTRKKLICEREFAFDDRSFYGVPYGMVDDLCLPLCDISSTIIQYGYPIVLTFGVVLKKQIFTKFPR